MIPCYARDQFGGFPITFDDVDAAVRHAELAHSCDDQEPWGVTYVVVQPLESERSEWRAHYTLDDGVPEMCPSWHGNVDSALEAFIAVAHDAYGRGAPWAWGFTLVRID